LPGSSSLKNLGQPEVLKRFNEAMDKAAGELGEGARKIRSALKLNNKGLLGEFMHDDELSGLLCKVMLTHLLQPWETIMLAPQSRNVVTL
jgi:hypothetical protein